MADPITMPDRAPAGYVWVIAELVHDKFCPAGYLCTRPWLGRFWSHSDAKKSIKQRAIGNPHNMTLVPVLIADMPVVVEDEA